MSFDGKITIALIVTVVLDTAAGLIWAGGAATRLAQVEHQIAMQQPVAERLARLEVRIEEQHLQLNRIEAQFDRPPGARR
jgi:hypothetical protein